MQLAESVLLRLPENGKQLLFLCFFSRWYSYYHSTSFRAFPGESRRKDLLLRANAASRTLIKNLAGSLVGRFINTGLHRGGRKSS